MIYDCFTFFNELDLLEIRLNTLNDVVDRFVLVEATQTFTGKDKPLHFNENKARFSPFLHKITHIIVDDFPAFETPWINENVQRNSIIRGLTALHPNDVMMISDVDEIPDPVMVEKHKNTPGVKLFEQKLYYYYLNYQNYSSPIWRLSTKMLSYRDFLNLDDKHVTYNEYLPASLNKGPTANKVRFYEKNIPIRNAGWHFSYLGGVDAIITKIQSFSHQEYNLARNRDPDWIRQCLQSGKDILGRSSRHFGVKIDDTTFPHYIVTHQQAYPHLIFPVTEAYLKKTKWTRPYFFIRGYIRDWLIFRVIPKSLHSYLYKLKQFLANR